MSLKCQSHKKRTWRIKPDQEYIWSMRMQKVARGSAATDEIRSEQSEETLPSYEKRQSVIHARPQKEARNIKTLASLLPDEVLYDIDDFTPKESECCLLFCDIRGVYYNLQVIYPTLSPNVRQRVNAQYDKLSAGLVQEVLSTGGDVMKITPTAMVAIWKCPRGSYITQQVHIAIDCALVIRKIYGSHAMEECNDVKVHFGITAGPLYFGVLGNEKYARFVFFGSIYEDIRKVVTTMNNKNILICPVAMQFVQTLEYNIKQVEDGPYYEIIGLTSMWKPARKVDYATDDTSAHRLEVLSTSYGTINTEVTQTQMEYSEECHLRPILQGLMEQGSSYIEKFFKFIQEGIRNEFLADQSSKSFITVKENTIMTIIVGTSISKWVRLFRTADDIYKMIQWYGVKYKGYVHNVSIYENSIMISMLFGLRGAAHVMMHRFSLLCAYDIMNAVKDVNRVNWVSIGICSDQAYYTQTGHMLRQDVVLFKTPFSTTLALSFTDKIICDQNTFIQSKMNPNCFSYLMDQKHLNPELPSESIYELISDTSKFNKELPVYDQPIVGRDAEIKVYKSLLAKFSRNMVSRENLFETSKAMFIKAYPREGKTRLLHEFIRVTDPRIPVHYISLQYGKADSPYYLIRKIFSIEFNCDIMTSDAEDRLAELQQRLQDMSQADLFWAINPVFHVNFPETASFWQYSAAEKFLARMKILKHLCYKVFVIPWIIMVDDVHYLDEESWSIVEVLLETNTFFLLMTRNRDRAFTSQAMSAFAKNSFVIKIKMETLNPIYISSIACQHLKVFAIPTDLEYVLQKKSSGNIGFIKSLLTNLSHRGFFTFKDITHDEIVEEQLSIPSLRFLLHLTDTEKEILFRASRKLKEDEKCEYTSGHIWHLFVESYQNIKFTKTRGKVYEVLLRTKKIPVCLLEKPLNAADLPEELSISIQIVQVYDSLTCAEQVILQCCSILGDSFPRMLLEHVLSLDYYHLLAPAIKTFFEAGILCCNQGDFTDGAQYTVMRSASAREFNSNQLECKCRGLFGQDRSRKLPSYAYCGLLRFRYSRFREHVYNMLLADAPVSYHSKVLLYLNEETRRCGSCGRDRFVFDYQKRLDDIIETWWFICNYDVCYR